MTSHDPAPPAPPPYDSSGSVPPPAPRRTGKLILVAIVALALGVGSGLLIGFLVFGGEGAEEDSRAVSSLNAGCTIIDRIHDDGPIHEEEFSALDDPRIWEMTAAGYLFTAAAAADEDYASWEESGRALMVAIQRFDLERADETIETLVSDCADR